MKPVELLKIIQSANSAAIVLPDEFVPALIGYSVGTPFTLPVYDIDIIIQVLMKRGISEEEAEKLFVQEIAMAEAGVMTPIFVQIPK
jgi:hypothetical protein